MELLVKEEAIKNAEKVDQAVVDARFNAWKTKKKRQKLEAKKKLSMQSAEYNRMMEELNIQRKKKIQKLKAETMKKNKMIELRRQRSSIKQPSKGSASPIVLSSPLKYVVPIF